MKHAVNKYGDKQGVAHKEGTRDLSPKGKIDDKILFLRYGPRRSLGSLRDKDENKPDRSAICNCMYPE